jgi:hypothetical protein
MKRQFVLYTLNKLGNHSAAAHTVQQNKHNNEELVECTLLSYFIFCGVKRLNVKLQ